MVKGSDPPCAGSRLDARARIGWQVVTVPVRVNANLKGVTLEGLIARRTAPTRPFPSLRFLQTATCRLPGGSAACRLPPAADPGRRGAVNPHVLPGNLSLRRG